jgi:uncharacterized protein YbjT (DUF2867 family)
MKIRAIITGATGMVGEGVLHECLLHPEVEKVLIVNRKPSGITDPKLTEIIVPDFFNLTSIESRLSGYNACFFCLGVSSVGMSEKDYSRTTYDLTMNFARVLARHNPDMTFCYVSGAGTDSTEKGSTMWARVKGKTENDLMKLLFKSVYAFRPGFMQPTPGLKNTLKGYAFFGWLYPVFNKLTPNYVSTLSQVGVAMIHIAEQGYEKQILEVKDIKKLAARIR